MSCLQHRYPWPFHLILWCNPPTLSLNIYIYIYIYINIIIIMSCLQHRYPWPFHLILWCNPPTLSLNIYIYISTSSSSCHASSIDIPDPFVWSFDITPLLFFSIYIYIKIIIMSCLQHRYPWPFHLILWCNPTTLSLSLSIYIYINIIIIIACLQHRYPWPFLATAPYCSSLLAGPHGYILYPYRAAVCRFGHMMGSIREHHLWVRPCFSSNILYVWFV